MEELGSFAFRSGVLKERRLERRSRPTDRSLGGEENRFAFLIFWEEESLISEWFWRDSYFCIFFSSSSAEIKLGRGEGRKDILILGGGGGGSIFIFYLLSLIFCFYFLVLESRLE